MRQTHISTYAFFKQRKIDRWVWFAPFDPDQRQVALGRVFSDQPSEALARIGWELVERKAMVDTQRRVGGHIRQRPWQQRQRIAGQQRRRVLSRRRDRLRQQRRAI